MAKPTIEEIERILDGEEVDIEILPNGEIRETRKESPVDLLHEFKKTQPTPFSY